MALAMSLSALLGAANPLVNRWVAKKRNPTYKYIVYSIFLKTYIFLSETGVNLSHFS